MCVCVCRLLLFLTTSSSLERCIEYLTFVNVNKQKEKAEAEVEEGQNEETKACQKAHSLTYMQVFTVYDYGEVRREKTHTHMHTSARACKQANDVKPKKKASEFLALACRLVCWLVYALSF